jgi:hypothetical protein
VFFKVELNIFGFKTCWATRGVVNVYSAGFVKIYTETNSLAAFYDKM